MDLSLEDMAKKNLYLANEKLKELFNALDNVCTENDDNERIFCDTLKNIKEEKSYYKLQKQFITIMKRSIEQRDTFLKNILPLEHDSCIYYKYWLYHKLLANYSENDSINEFIIDLNESLYSNLGVFNLTCKPHTTSLHDVKIIKVLYDHILFSDSTQYEHKIIDEIKKCQFCKYFKQSLKKVFANGRTTCSTSSPFAICMEYNKHLNKFFKLSELISLSCENDPKVSHYQSSDLSGQGDIKVTLENPTEEDVITVSKGEGESLYQPVESNDSHSYVNGVIGTFTVLGIFSILFFMYKFTPFGPWLHSSLLKKKTIIPIVNEEVSGLEENIYDFSNSETHNARHHIGYNPVLNI